MWRRSITVRLVLYFGIVSTAVLLAIGITVGRAVEGHFVEMDEMELHGKLELVRHVLAKVRTAEDIARLPERMDDALTGHEGLVVRIAKPDGTDVFSSPGAYFPPGLFAGVPADAFVASAPATRSWNHDGHGWRGFAVSAATPAVTMPAAVVALALATDQHERFMAMFYRSLWLAIVAGIVAAVLLGWWAAARGLQPVREMASVAGTITASRLNERLPMEALPVELRELGLAFNAMLSRLEESFRRLTEFSSDIAHELRTPIANMMTQTQVALSRSRSVDEYREVLYSNTEEFDRLARMITDMLFLAKADHGLIVPRREAVELAREVGELFEFYDALAEDRGVGLTLTGSGIVEGERLMLRRAISNLLSNALNHTARGGVVAVTMGPADNGWVRVSVENPGPTIGAEHLERIFDRFYRIDPSRQRSTEGAGLGLAITKSIVAAHHGIVRASSQDQVTRFEMLLPAGDRPAGSSSAAPAAS